MIARREFLAGAVGAAVSLGTRSLFAREGAPRDRFGPKELPAGALDSAALHALPGKDPLVKRTFRPPNYETPVAELGERFTDNRKFFVRYHLSGIPEIDPKTWRLRVGGEAVESPFEIGLEELGRAFEPVEIPAVCQCSGNRRGLSSPHVPGIQWGYGAMGNARWKGVRLRDLLLKARLRRDALEVVFDGADAGVFPKTPDFVKSLPIWKATDPNALVALEMNGEPLPRWNGFPARVVVPGWTATYWVKHLVSIEVVARPYAGFWMKRAYRVPKGLFPMVDRFVSQESDLDTPITEILVNSLVTSPPDGERFARGETIGLEGIAWDGGYGIARVEVSIDGGRTWSEAALGPDEGRFSWRRWSYRFAPAQPGPVAVRVRATNRLGMTQPSEPLFNPAGYHHNAVARLELVVEPEAAR